LYLVFLIGWYSEIFINLLITKIQIGIGDNFLYNLLIMTLPDPPLGGEGDLLPVRERSLNIFCVGK
jgi:hypothetical protein